VTTELFKDIDVNRYITHLTSYTNLVPYNLT